MAPSVAARERELRAAQREADIDRVASLENALVDAHHRSFAKPKRTELPPPAQVAPRAIEQELEMQMGIPGLIELLGGGEAPPAAPDPEPVDRYELMRAHRKRERQGVPIYRVRDRIAAAREADEAAEAAARVEAERRRELQRSEQARLDGLWEQLQQARATVAEKLGAAIAAEEQSRAEERDRKQQALDEAWDRLNANDPQSTADVLEQAFADNESPAAPLGCEGERTTVAMRFAVPEAIVPERKSARTPTGKRTLKKRTKTEINALYRQSLGSHVLATVKEAFAVAPGTQLIHLVVIRRESSADRVGGEAAVIYCGEFDRPGYDGASASRDPGKALTLAPRSEINLKGKTEEISPIDLSQRPDLQGLLDRSEAALGAPPAG